MRAAVILILALCAPAFGANLFAQWKTRYGKTYTSTEEESMRSAIFNANVAKINAHNIQGESWTMAINEFTDLTSQEFAIGRIGGYKPRNLRRSGSSPVKSNLPSSVDWTTKGAVTPVKNQGQCGSCWSFSTTGSVEGAEKIFKDKLVSLSEQMLVDCSTAYGNDGCQGGLMDDAFQYIIANKGLCTEASYPYTATGPNTCQTSCTVVPESAITTYTDVTVDSDSALATAVAQQPVSVAIEADQSSFQFYSGGVMTAACGTALDHGVLAVGYGTDSGTEYWKVKNSWGASWGEAGYIRLGRGASYNGGAGQCGIYSAASYPGF